jgi:hypothetical protein
MKTPLLLSLTLISAALAQTPDRPRIFLEESNSWEMGGGAGAVGGTGGGAVSGGARPQTVELMKTFRERCPGVIITMDKAKADYVVVFDREGGKDLVRRDNKIAVFRNGGDLLHAGSTRSLGNAVKDACYVLLGPQAMKP